VKDRHKLLQFNGWSRNGKNLHAKSM
jgi:hypothetical protein